MDALGISVSKSVESSALSRNPDWRETQQGIGRERFSPH
jgi:hypothetical protein